MTDPTTFATHRSRLFGIAYRMTGSVMDAEDLVQETYLRWSAADTGRIDSPLAYLTTIITRLAIDHLRSAQVQRETYIGPWLPEPLLTSGEPGVAETVAQNESISFAFLVMLETLKPVERAVFLLREVFDYPYTEIAAIVGESEANCRQIVRRARQRLAVPARPSFDVRQSQQAGLADRFTRALASADMSGLLQLLAGDAVMTSDGGGRVSAARHPVYGADKVARFLLGLVKKAPPNTRLEPAEINGEIGLIIYVDDAVYGTLLIEGAGAAVQAVRAVVNPDKLKGIRDRRPEE